MISETILLKTKTSLPASRDKQLLRTRLMDAITHNLAGKLTTVIAPAGFGKTTLLTQTIHHHQLSAAWVSLDDRDNDSIRFWRYVLQAVIAAGSPLLSERLSPLGQLLPGMTIYTFLDAFINELIDIPGPLVIVLDDYHRIADERIHEGLSYFIDYLPDHIHVIISSRAELPFSTSKWRVREQLDELAIGQLQFTLEETQAFYREVSHLPLSPGQIKRLFERTEGWVAGLQLVSISLRSTMDYDRYIDSFSGLHRNIADYLFNEVMANLPSAIHSFLLQTSVLERINAALCNDVTGKTDGQDMLTKLRTMNLFLIPLDPADTWFRYHHLFSEFLRSLIRRNHPLLWSQGNRSASRSFMAQGMTDEAINHAILGEDYEYAIYLLGEHAPVLFQRGEFSTLLRWFEAIEQRAELPSGLSLLHSFMLVVTGQLVRAAAALARIEERHLPKADAGERRQIRSGLLFVKSNLVFYNYDFAGWYRFSEEITGEVLPENPIFYNFNYNMSEPLVRRTAMGLKGVLSPDTEAIACQFMGLIESHGWKDSLINLYVNQSLAEGLYEWNRLDESLACLHKGEQSPRFEEIAGLYVPGQITLAGLQAVRGSMEQAIDTIH
ncbi:transcriptional regulator, partial [Paenibacillus sepulcri]|nr:transcriptional regulator [Paenibacillus sepulcri]